MVQEKVIECMNNMDSVQHLYFFFLLLVSKLYLKKYLFFRYNILFFITLLLNLTIMIPQKKTLLCLLLLTAGILRSYGQQSVTVLFNEKGQIADSLPSLLTTKDQIRFQVLCSLAEVEKKEQNAYMLFLQTIMNLDEKDKKNKQNYKVLQAIGLGITADGSQKELQQVQAILAKQLLDFLKDHSDVIAKMPRSVKDDTYALNNFLVAGQKFGDLPNLRIPKLEDFSDVLYGVRYGFKNGYNINETYYPCPVLIDLQKAKTKCCSFTWSSPANEIEDIYSYPFRGAFTNAFKLILHNTNLEIYNRQAALMIKDKVFINAIYYKDIVKSLNTDVVMGPLATVKNVKGNKSLPKKDDKNPKLAVDDDYVALLAWMQKKYDHSNADKEKALAEKVSPAKISAFQVNLKTVYSNDVKPINGPTAIDFLFSLAWMTQGKSLIANPLGVPSKPDIKAALDKVTDSVNNFNRAESELTARIGMVKSEAAAASSGCCKTENIKALDREYVKLQAVLDAKDTMLVLLKKHQDSIAKLPAAYTKTLAKLDHDFYRDSLLYSGLFVINQFQDICKAPNQPGYHFMRNHNALDDVHHFDRNVQRNINELQHVDIFAVNSDRNAKYALGTTFADLNVTDFFSQELVNAAKAPSAGEHKQTESLDAKVALDALYADYKTDMDFLNIYKNGVIDQHLTELQDTTADYVTSQIPHAGPETPGKITSYPVTDQITKKNLSSENMIFSYNYDKLVRFSFKAGIGYSWLRRRTYSINQTSNTATYTDSYAGLAPVIGFQVFTEKIDMQNEHFMPVTWHPFVYVGYMFHDTPANNFLFGAGLELVSGISFIAGAHLGKTQGLTLEQGNLQEKDYYKIAPFVSISVGIQAFKTIFSSSTLTDPLK